DLVRRTITREKRVDVLALARDGRRAVTRGDGNTIALTDDVWNSSSLPRLIELDAHVSAAWFSGDESALYVAAGDEVTVHDPFTLEIRSTLRGYWTRELFCELGERRALVLSRQRI